MEQQEKREEWRGNNDMVLCCGDVGGGGPKIPKILYVLEEVVVNLFNVLYVGNDFEGG